MTLRLAASPRTPCFPWKDREQFHDAPHPIGAQCAECSRDVALDPTLIAYQPVCMYCALDSGLLPLVEIELGDNRSLHQIAVDHGATPRSGRVQ